MTEIFRITKVLRKMTWKNMSRAPGLLYAESSFYLFVFSLMKVFIFVSWFLLAFAWLVPTLKKL